MAKVSAAGGAGTNFVVVGVCAGARHRGGFANNGHAPVEGAPCEICAE